MRNTCLRTSFVRRLSAAAALGLSLFAASTSWSQLSVGPSGLPTQTFDTFPTVAEGWSTISVGTSAGTYTTAEAIDTAVIANTDASVITTALGTSTTYPPSQNGPARWNGSLTDPLAGRHFIQTRPTGNEYTLLMATLRNDSGTDQAQIVVSYDWNQHNANPVNEDVPGHRVYYSTTGAPGSWTLLPDLSTFTTTSTAQTLSTAIVFGSPWANGSLLYIIWVDDNGPGGTSNPMEGAYSIDNFAVNFSLTAPSITTQPAGVTNAEYSVVSLSVAVSGSGPFTYAWTRNGAPVPGTHGNTLQITNMTGSGFTWSRPEDSGNYAVTVTGSANPPAVSETVHVSILPDTNAPTFLWALADTNSVGDLVIRVALSERVDNSLSQLSEPLYWSVLKVSGPGADLNSPADPANIIIMTNVAFANTNTLEVQLIYPGAALDPNTSYQVTFDAVSEGPLFDRAQTPNNMAVHEVAIHTHRVEVVALNHEWKYSDLDVPPVGNWWEAAYDDSDSAFWKSGLGVFDAKREGCRTTALHNLGPVGTCLTYSNANAPANITNYYFRTHFTFNGQPQASGMLILNGKYDDGAVVFLNGVEIQRAGVNATNVLSHTMYASRTVGDSDARDVSYIFPGSLLHAGDNVLAVQVAQVNGTSSDATMGLSVDVITIDPLAAPVSQPQLHVSFNGSQVSVSWSPAGGSLLEAPSVTGPWTTNAAASNPHVFTPAAGGQKFFRVAQ